MLWGSRFDKPLDDIAMNFSSSLKFDVNLFEYDIKVSKAHVKMLAKCEIISDEDKNQILEGLEKVRIHFRSEYWKPDPSLFEDIHSAIEIYLTELIGDVAGKLHSGRSRNDLVVTSFRLWMKESAEKLKNEIISFQNTILKIAENNLETIMPGYTHLQRAQPVSFGFHMMAYHEMIKRDIKRIEFLLEEIDVMPLGSGALAGSTLNIDRKYTADLLGFSKISKNAMDAISDRDFVLDFHNSVSTGMMHLSRLAEELIIWSTSEFNFVQIDDQFTTGSSLMPQKKNPDLAELIRGKTGRIYGNQLSALTMMKGLSLSYNRDMQEDKEAVFDSFEVYFHSLKIMNGMIDTLKINKNRFTDELDGSNIFATDLADKLVEKGIPFRKAHSIIGDLVKESEKKNRKLNELSYDQIKALSVELSDILLETIDIKNCLKNKNTQGSPNPDFVKLHLTELK